jgi:hypothetical protein
VLRIFSIVVLGLLLASAAAGETIYKYRQADGRVVYSNRPLPDAVLLEQFEYELSAPAGIEGDREKNRLEAEQRIAKHLAALEQAWNEVQEARQALARAEERLRTEIEPTADESRQLAAPADTAPPAAGGPQRPAHPLRVDRKTGAAGRWTNGQPPWRRRKIAGL